MRSLAPRGLLAHYALVLLWLAALLVQATTHAAAPTARDETALASLAAGRTDTADAAWWGFDASDATDAVQAEFIRCTSENTGREAVRLMNKSADGARVRFVECRWLNAWTARHRDYGGPRVPILIRGRTSERCRESGGVEFVDCRVEDSIDGPTLRFEDDDGRGVLRNVTGTIRVDNPKGAHARFGLTARDVNLQIIDTRTRP